ncbi:MAG: hypothetical protein KAS04_01225 [Candidatus Aenigmarchaeota archaeon]|nr:hypothetical protein [Candidatus Aenigmarchaeota archaeon]
MDKQKFREAVTNIMLMEYLPKLQTEFSRFMQETEPKRDLVDWLTYVVGVPVSIEMGELKIAEPSNEFIDKIVDLVYVKNK